MPITDGLYKAPTWKNGAPPALDAAELQAISDTLEKNDGKLENVPNFMKVSHTQIFTTTQDWEIPPAIDGKFHLTMVGGGGGAFQNVPTSTGGGGSGYFYRGVVTVSMGGSLRITVGEGAAKGQNAGSNGGTTSFGTYASVVGGGGAKVVDKATGRYGSDGGDGLAGGGGGGYFSGNINCDTYVPGGAGGKGEPGFGGDGGNGGSGRTGFDSSSVSCCGAYTSGTDGTDGINTTESDEMYKGTGVAGTGSSGYRNTSNCNLAYGGAGGGGGGYGGNGAKGQIVKSGSTLLATAGGGGGGYGSAQLLGEDGATGYGASGTMSSTAGNGAGAPGICIVQWNTWEMA